MGFFDDYFDPQQYESGRGLTGWLEALQQQQEYQPGAFGGWPPPGSTVGPTTERQQVAPVPVTPQPSGGQPAPYPPGNVPTPIPRPADIPSGSMAIGDYLMPQFGDPQGSQYSQPGLGDRLGAGFRSWAYTPLGNPFAALANAITGFSTGQFAAAPQLRSPDSRLRSPVGSPEDSARIQPASAAVPAVSPTIQAWPTARALMRRGSPPRR